MFFSYNKNIKTVSLSHFDFQHPEGQKTEENNTTFCTHTIFTVSTENCREGREGQRLIDFFTISLQRLTVQKTDCSEVSCFCISIKEFGRPLRNSRRREKTYHRKSQVELLMKDLEITKVIYSFLSVCHTIIQTYC